MDSMASLVFVGLLFVTSCQSLNSSRITKEVMPQLSVNDGLSLAVNYANHLESLSGQELRAECERYESAPRTDLEEIKHGLAQSALYTHNHSYQKAADLLSQLANRSSFSPDVKVWFKLLSQNILDRAHIDKELQAEKRQKQELERKINALSELEKEMSRRDLKQSTR